MQREVLVVDDDVGFANGLAAKLQASGYRARVAYDGNEALRDIADHDVDVVLADIVMPGMVGYTLMEAAQALPGRRDVPFVFMSVLNEAKVRSFFECYVPYLQKPFGVPELLATLDRILSEGSGAPS